MVKIEKIIEVLKDTGLQYGFAAAIWGSCLRGEITHLSDVDIIAYSADNRDYTDIVRNHLTLAFPHDTIYWDVAFVEGRLNDFIRQNGTNFHSIIFAGEPVGDEYSVMEFLREKKCALDDHNMIIREVFNLFTSYWGLAHIISTNDDRYGKFSIDGTNKWTRLFQAAQLRWKELRTIKAIDVLSFLCQRYNLNKNEYIYCYNRDFEKREYYETNSKKIVTEHIINDEWMKLFEMFILDNINWMQEYGVEVELFTRFLNRILPSNNIIVPKPKQINTLATRVLQAYVVEEEKEINELVRNNNDDWWVLTNICVNPNTSSSCLHEIVFPDFEVNKILWKSIRLYVAKNINTSEDTLRQLLRTKGLREQDYKAAQTNLSNRFQYVMR